MVSTALATMLVASVALLACDHSSEPRDTSPAATSASTAASTPLASSSSSSSSSASPTAPPDPLAVLPLSERAAFELSSSLQSALAIATLPQPPPDTKTIFDTFVLVAGDPKAPLDEAAALAQKTVDALYAGPLRHRPETAVTLRIYSSHAAFVQGLPLGAPHNAFGLYYPDSRVIFVDTSGAGIFSVSHELSHPLLEADFPLAPEWLVEGIASLYELPSFTTSPAGVPQISGKPHFRLQTLRDSLDDPKLAPHVRLDVLFSLMDAKTFRDPKLYYLNYALSREMMRWLDSRRHQLWSFYHRWREDILDDPTGEKSFASVVGSTPDAATDAWLQWLQSDEAAQ